MGVGANARPVNEVQRPVEVPTGLGLVLEACQDLLPEAGPLPAAKTAVQRLPVAKVAGRVAPRGAGAEAPKNAVEHLAKVRIGATGRWSRRRELALQMVPLGIGEIVTMDVHLFILHPFANRPWSPAP